MKNIKVFKSYSFKLHNLSKSKRAQVDKTLVQNNYTFYHSLKAVKPLALELVGKTKTEKRDGLSSIKKVIAQAVKPLPFGGAVKASTVEDVAAQVSSFIELTEIGQQANFPDRTDEELDYHLALSQLLTSTTKEHEDSARDEMARSLKGGIRPLSFYKSRTSDGFLMLADDKNRLFTFVNLWSAKDKRAKKITVEMTNTRTGEPIKFNTSTGLLLPITCSNWHKNALINGQAKAAKLIKRGDEYLLNIAIEHEALPIEVETTMGIDRGIEELASYAVRKESGEVIASKNFDGTVLREHQRLMENKQKVSQKKGRRLIDSYSNYSNYLLHHVANEIVKKAVKYKSQVVLEDLSNITNGHNFKRAKFARKSNFRRMLSRQQYAKLQLMLEYKLQAEGLPKPRFVAAAYTSLTCPSCGFADKANRVERSVFKCVECNYHAHADVLGAINIAGKQMWLKNVGKKIKGTKLIQKYKFNVWQSENLSL